MGDLLQFRPRSEMMPPPPPAVVRTTADDEHDAACWMNTAMRWGWNVKEFRTNPQALTGFILFHDAAGEDTPLYTLVRSEKSWRLWNRKRELTEFDDLDSALESVFPTQTAAEA